MGWEISALASRRHGLITSQDLGRLGCDASRIRRWRRSGRLHRLHRGVYAVGHASLTREARWLAAVLACGPGALLSHLSAAALWGLLKIDPRAVHIVVPRARRGHEGIRVHRTRRLDSSDRVVHRGIPVTSPERTWFDLASMLSVARLRRVLSEGEREGTLDPASLAASLDQRRGVRGMGNARRLLASYLPAPAGTAFRSDLERTFWEAWRETGLELPEVNGWALGFEIDVLWRRRRLAVELDGGRYHRTALDRERDRAREAALSAGGFELLRFSDTELEANLPAVIAAVSTRYRDRGDSGGAT